MWRREFGPPFDYQAIVDRPPVVWPGGARVAVWVVPNVEHFHPELFEQAPDIRNYSRRDYGNRVGIWRLMDVLTKHGIRGTVALNGEVGLQYPRILEAITALQWELMGHGMTNSIRSSGMSIEAERAMIGQVRAVVEGFGQRMRGWLGPGLAETWNSLDLLREAGVEYVCDWVNDDLPYRMDNGMYAIPYSIEVNDMPLFNTPSIGVADFERIVCDTFDVLFEEGGRVMCIALHPFLIGAPHRIRYLDRALQHIVAHDQVWLATGSEIIDAYRASGA